MIKKNIIPTEASLKRSFHNHKRIGFYVNIQNILSRNIFILVAIILFLAISACHTSKELLVPQLAVANGNHLKIFNAKTDTLLYEINDYQEVMKLAYRPDGGRLAVVTCSGNRAVEYRTNPSQEVVTHPQGVSCPWALAYSPDNQSLAVTLPIDSITPNGHLQVYGQFPLDSIMGSTLPTLAYRPDGRSLAVSTNRGLVILGIAENYPVLHEIPDVFPTTLAYSNDGSRLFAGMENGWVILNAADQYRPGLSVAGEKVLKIAFNPAGGWFAVLCLKRATVYRLVDLEPITTIITHDSFDTFSDADFSPDGSTLRLAESEDYIRTFKAPDWAEADTLSVPGRINAIAHRPLFFPRIPVVFIHGHSVAPGKVWFEPYNDGTCLADVLAANPEIPIDTYCMSLPLHGNGQNLDRSIAEDAKDIRALIEGGTDSYGAEQIGLINLPKYQEMGKVAIVGYSQGAISARYYIKNLMDSTRIPVYTFVALAAPNHGMGGAALCNSVNGADQTLRQLCSGITATLASQAAGCGDCGVVMPPYFSNNQPEDIDFFVNLNGHPYEASCDSAFEWPDETPFSRPSTSNGILYVNLYAADNNDLLAGGDTQSLDCIGRRLARLHAPDVHNLPIADVPYEFLTGGAHRTFPHHGPVICTMLQAIVSGQVPEDPASACNGFEGINE